MAKGTLKLQLQEKQRQFNNSLEEIKRGLLFFLVPLSAAFPSRLWHFSEPSLNYFCWLSRELPALGEDTGISVLPRPGS